MRGNSLRGGLTFAAFAALGAVPWTMVAGPLLGRANAVGLFCLATAVLYAAWIAPSWSRALRVGALAALLALVVGALAPGLGELAAGAALVIAVVRSGFLYRSRPARVLALEGLLLVGGLVFARALAGPTPLGVGLAFWGFFLVQSLYFLAGGVGERGSEDPGIDPFERARKEALALMDGPDS